MNERFDLNHLLEEIKKDASLKSEQNKIVTQKEISEMIKTKKRNKRKNP